MRSIFLKSFTIFLFFSYFVLTIISIFISIPQSIPFYNHWFSSLLLISGTSLYVRYLCYRINSNLFAGTILFLSGLWGIINFYFNFDITLKISGYIFSFAFAFFLIFIKFRQLFHFKAFAFLILYVILLIVYSSELMPLWLFISLLTVVSLMIALIMFKRIKRNFKKV